ncbi:helix-turn-helix transcriptional regulator [Rhodococcus sp. ARC_M6]|uniref:helix-turn-helix domain-containing protein n=1 Tax=Rhodococcus sp. ARC_M6 TaxID=2928852 RepID=UPI001FB23948|nr:helix-turn-helix transcriptional regulator [Rhodococcus sp. ARC_M6]
MAVMSGFSEWVKSQLELRPYGDIQDAARALKIRPSELSRWLASKRPPTQDTMRTASRIFDVPILEILIAAEYLTAEEAGVDPRTDPTSTPHAQDFSSQKLTNELSRRKDLQPGGTFPVVSTGIAAD